MEILDVFGIHWKLLAAQAVNFAIALFVLHRYAYKPIWKMLDERQKKIAQGLSDAKAAAEAKASAEGERTSILSSARAEGGKIVDELRKQGVENEREIIREAQEKSRGILQDAERRAAEERAHLLRESEKDVAKMAVLAAEKILRSNS